MRQQPLDNSQSRSCLRDAISHRLEVGKENVNFVRKSFKVVQRRVRTFKATKRHKKGFRKRN